MDMPRQAKPQPRLFMQEIVGRQWTPEAERHRSSEIAVVDEKPKPERKRKKAAPTPCLPQLMTFSVA